MSAIVIPPMGGAGDAAWRFVLTLAARPDTPPWVLVGGLMVQLHALEHGMTDVRATRDADVLVDLRAAPNGIRVMCDVLASLGLEFEGANSHGVGHRFSRGSGANAVSVDVLAPDRLGIRTSTVTIPPARTVQMPGGRRILQHTEAVEVTYDHQRAILRRPALIAAVIGKSRAWVIDTSSPARDRHLEDAAMLLAVLPDPIDLAARLDGKERAAMRTLAALLPPTHSAWRRLGDTAADGISALSFLSA